jgi:hypothetical protein
LGAGEYTLTVSANPGVEDEDYSFSLIDLFNGTTITPDTPFTKPTVSNNTVAFNFQAEAGDDLFFRVVNHNSVSGRWTFLDPYGGTIFSTTAMSQHQGPHAAPYSGEYSLFIEGNTTTQSQFNFEVNRVSNVDKGPIVLGTEYSELLPVAKRHVYTLNVPAGQTKFITFDSTALDSSGYEWTLTGPNGAEVTERRFTEDENQQVLKLGSGTYTLTVMAIDATINSANYKFKFLDIFDGITLPPNGVVEDVSLLNGTKIYNFVGTTGQELLFNSREYVDSSSRWRLIDPLGNQVGTASSIASDFNATLPFSGEYSLIIE